MYAKFYPNIPHGRRKITKLRIEIGPKFVIMFKCGYMIALKFNTFLLIGVTFIQSLTFIKMYTDHVLVWYSFIQNASSCQNLLWKSRLNIFISSYSLQSIAPIWLNMCISRQNWDIYFDIFSHHGKIKIREIAPSCRRQIDKLPFVRNSSKPEDWHYLQFKVPSPFLIIS